MHSKQRGGIAVGFALCYTVRLFFDDAKNA